MILAVNDMSCGHCANAITKAIQTLSPSIEVNVDLQSKTVTIEGTATVSEVIQVIKNAGFTEVQEK